MFVHVYLTRGLREDLNGREVLLIAMVEDDHPNLVYQRSEWREKCA